MAAQAVDGERYMSIDGKLVEIKRQLRLRGGYPYDLEKLEAALQRITEGNFDSLPVDHRRVHVSYVLPSFEELNGTLFDRASKLWDGQKWEQHPSCVDIDTTPHELVFYMKHFGKVMTSDRVIGWAEANGYRAANHLETLAYAMANPVDQRKFWYVGLGSFVLDAVGRCVACLFNYGSKCELDDGYLHARWSPDHRFLLVRK